MQDEPEVAVLGLGHRPGRDERMTTRVGLTARALGADRVLLESEAGGAKTTTDDVTARFGGPFEAELLDSPEVLLRGWPGAVVHRTMYGFALADVSPLADLDGRAIVRVEEAWAARVPTTATVSRRFASRRSCPGRTRARRCPRCRARTGR